MNSITSLKTITREKLLSDSYLTGNEAARLENLKTGEVALVETWNAGEITPYRNNRLLTGPNALALATVLSTWPAHFMRVAM